MKKIGFIGCGNMGGALAGAVKNTGKYQLYICDVNTNRAADLAEELNAQVKDAKTIIAECDYVFMGVKPQVLAAAFEEIKGALAARSDIIIVSMAAGVSIDTIKALSEKNSIIRIMPNIPVSVGEGVVLAASENVCAAARDEFADIMSKAGVFDWIDEKLIDAASAVSGCGPAFVYMFLEALADGAVACGLPRDKALTYAAGTIKGSAETYLETRLHPERLKDSVCSPAGSTIMGVKALEDGGFRSAAMNAVIESYKRTKELG